MYWYLTVIKQYAVFSGRARRAEYWMFVLFHALAMFLLAVIATAGGIAVHAATDGSPLGMLFLAPYVLYSLAMIVPTYAVIVRRLHDTGRSGLWLLMLLAPFGEIVLLVFMCLDGEPHDNQYGPNPKGPVPPYGYGPQGPGFAAAPPVPYGGMPTGQPPLAYPPLQPGPYPGNYPGAQTGPRM